MSERIVLGSGKLYIDEFDKATGIPANAEIEVESKLLGLISGGASITYTPSFTEHKDDLGLVVKKMLTDEVATLKSGIMTFNGNTLKQLCSTATVSEDAENKKRTVKIGGIGNYDGKAYVLRFVHEDAVDGDIRVTIVGSNEGGLELVFNKDNPTVINAEFKAQPCDTEGTLIIYEEEDLSIVDEGGEE